MASIPSSVDVAIIGAGPTGLATASTLRKNGVNAIVLDAAASPSTTSRATVIHSRTLEVLEDMGVTSNIIQRGVRLTRWTLSDKKSILVDLDFSTLKAKYPMMITLAQVDTEAALTEKFEAFGGVVYRAAEVTSVLDSGDKVQLQVHSPATGMKTTVTAKYVVAADGIRSTIREAVGIPFEGGEYPTSFITADCRLSATGKLRKDGVQLHVSSQGFMLLLPEPRGIWRLVATLDQAPKDADVALYQRLVDERAAPGIVVSEYRKGRVFLAGDAAHAHSPAGGQGMNIGIQDGVRLGEVLSEAVLAGKTSDDALGRYEGERRPVAKGVVALTHRMTMMGTLKAPFLGAVRNWFLWAVMSMPWARYWMTYRLSELDH
ncbi:Pentachlorophenol 4-monooxygenase [Cytospora mali]|uniref:Pentachlorophenol 4-monooxygenase n=1 Tax=Cytospora mali TaxID=578113 RepID=A0A194UU11_CYTMA|nr:Pentachlorophenol 4-monooxygenase [Valsa mali var. pyri (nom. inval.)]